MSYYKSLITHKIQEDSDDSSQKSGVDPSFIEDGGENGSDQDLDASMEDLDDELGGDSDDTNEGNFEESEEEPS